MRINDNNCVDKAENVIKNLVKGARKNFKGEPDIVTTSKIRNLLAMNADIYNQVLTKSSEKLDDEICGRIEYLRVRFMYECGREPKVKEFVQQAEILEIDVYKRQTPIVAPFSFTYKNPIFHLRILHIINKVYYSVLE